MSTPEEKARMSGWVPQEEFKGDPERWTDAETWNDRAENLMPIMKATNKRLEDKLSTTEARLAELQTTIQKIINANEKISQREYNRALETIRSQKKEAVTNADGEAFAALEKQEKELEKTRPEPISTGANPRQALTDFESRNSAWYGKDEDMTDYAEIVSNRLQRQGIVDPVDQLKKVEEAVKKKYPEKFGNPRREETTVDTSINPPPKKAKKFSYDSLPKEAQSACDKAIKDCLRVNPNLKADDEKAKWVKIYYEDDMEA